MYQGIEEIGSYRETGECTSYRVLAYPENSVVPRTVYMELEGNKPGSNWYVPQIDAQGSITHLLDPRTAAITSLKRHTAFGELLSAGLPTGFLESSSETSVISPWGYFSKRLDPDLGLIDFGKRWYDPQQARWTTLDPAGFVDGTNLYRFVKNNPLFYTDPDGQWAIVIPIVQITATAVTWLTAKVALAIAGTAAITYGVYKASEYDNAQERARREREYNHALLDAQYKPLYLTKHPDYKPENPAELDKDPDWKDTTHPEEAKRGRKKFTNEKTGEILEFDKGRPGTTGHEQFDHYHRRNPKSVNRHDKYLDNKGNPCGDTKDSYHLYNPNVDKWDY